MKKLLWIFLFLVVIVSLFYFTFNTGKKAQAEWTEEDFNKGIEKSKVKINNIEEININALVNNNFSTKGTNNIDDFFTDKELSALISKANNSMGPVKNIEISLVENGNSEISFVLSESFINFLKEQEILLELNNLREAQASEYQENTNNTESNIKKELSITEKIVSYLSSLVNKKPIHGTGKLFKDSNNLIKIKIDTLKVGRVSLPQKTIDKVEYETIRILNLIISKENGFYVEELEIRDGGLYYKGTLPAEIEGEKI